jgi:hypothetical protein
VTDGQPRAPDLRTEARALHRALFRSDPPEQIVARYVAAHSAGLGACSPAESAWLDSAVRAGVDLSALEFVLRRRNRKHVLVRKFHMMAYIAEGSAGYAPAFLNDEPRRARAFVELAFALLGSIWKFLRGQYLLWRYQ